MARTDGDVQRVLVVRELQTVDQERARSPLVHEGSPLPARAEPERMQRRGSSPESPPTPTATVPNEK